VTEQQQAYLGQRIDEVENPDWYVELLGIALEEVGDDNLDQAIKITDRTYSHLPQPPATAEDDDLQQVADTLAVADYAKTASFE
jgi:hypothetical protein